jgi:CRISPR/Cas system-associated endoribonuclease Cas2
MPRKSELVDTILDCIFIAGVITIAWTSPQFGTKVVPQFFKYLFNHSRRFKYTREKSNEYSNSFYRLKRQGLIKIEFRGKQLHISLTEKGKKRAGKIQIDGLKIKKQKSWDGKWRILIFDIAENHKIKREAVRGKLKEWNLYKLQKSVWVCPYEFVKEIKALREFFGLNEKEMRAINAQWIEDDKLIRKHFRI